MLLESLFGFALLALAHSDKHPLLSILSSDDYDKNTRPGYGKGTNIILVSIHVQNAKWENGEATLLMYLRQYWTDERLAFGNKQDLNDYAVSGPNVINQMWKPDTFIIGTIMTRAENEQFVRITTAGAVSWSQLVSAKVPCTLPAISPDAKLKELVIANCSITLESYGFSSMDLDLQWKQGITAVSVNSDLIPNAEDGVLTGRKVILLSTGNYTELEMTLGIQVVPGPKCDPAIMNT